MITYQARKTGAEEIGRHHTNENTKRRSKVIRIFSLNEPFVFSVIKNNGMSVVDWFDLMDRMKCSNGRITPVELARGMRMLQTHGGGKGQAVLSMPQINSLFHYMDADRSCSLDLKELAMACNIERFKTKGYEEMLLVFTMMQDLEDYMAVNGLLIQDLFSHLDKDKSQGLSRGQMRCGFQSTIEENDREKKEMHNRRTRAKARVDASRQAMEEVSKQRAENHVTVIKRQSTMGPKDPLDCLHVPCDQYDPWELEEYGIWFKVVRERTSVENVVVYFRRSEGSPVKGMVVHWQEAMGNISARATGLLQYTDANFIGTGRIRWEEEGPALVWTEAGVAAPIEKPIRYIETEAEWKDILSREFASKGEKRLRRISHWRKEQLTALQSKDEDTRVTALGEVLEFVHNPENLWAVTEKLVAAVIINIRQPRTESDQGCLLATRVAWKLSEYHDFLDHLVAAGAIQACSGAVVGLGSPWDGPLKYGLQLSVQVMAVGTLCRVSCNDGLSGKMQGCVTSALIWAVARPWGPLECRREFREGAEGKVVLFALQALARLVSNSSYLRGMIAATAAPTASPQHLDSPSCHPLFAALVFSLVASPSSGGGSVAHPQATVACASLCLALIATRTSVALVDWGGVMSALAALTTLLNACMDQLEGAAPEKGGGRLGVDGGGEKEGNVEQVMFILECATAAMWGFLSQLGGEEKAEDKASIRRRRVQPCAHSSSEAPAIAAPLAHDQLPAPANGQGAVSSRGVRSPLRLSSYCVFLGSPPTPQPPDKEAILSSCTLTILRLMTAQASQQRNLGGGGGGAETGRPGVIGARHPPFPRPSIAVTGSCLAHIARQVNLAELPPGALATLLRLLVQTGEGSKDIQEQAMLCLNTVADIGYSAISTAHTRGREQRQPGRSAEKGAEKGVGNGHSSEGVGGDKGHGKRGQNQVWYNFCAGMVAGEGAQIILNCAYPGSPDWSNSQVLRERAARVLALVCLTASPPASFNTITGVTSLLRCQEGEVVGRGAATAVWALARTPENRKAFAKLRTVSCLVSLAAWSNEHGHSSMHVFCLAAVYLLSEDPENARQIGAQEGMVTRLVRWATPPARRRGVVDMTPEDNASAMCCIGAVRRCLFQREGMEALARERVSYTLLDLVLRLLRVGVWCRAVLPLTLREAQGVLFVLQASSPMPTMMDRAEYRGYCEKICSSVFPVEDTLTLQLRRPSLAHAHLISDAVAGLASLSVTLRSRRRLAVNGAVTVLGRLLEEAIGNRIADGTEEGGQEGELGWASKGGGVKEIRNIVKLLKNMSAVASAHAELIRRPLPILVRLWEEGPDEQTASLTCHILGNLCRSSVPGVRNRLFQAHLTAESNEVRRARFDRNGAESIQSTLFTQSRGGHVGRGQDGEGARTADTSRREETFVRSCEPKRGHLSKSSENTSGEYSMTSSVFQVPPRRGHRGCTGRGNGKVGNGEEGRGGQWGMKGLFPTVRFEVQNRLRIMPTNVWGERARLAAEALERERAGTSEARLNVTEPRSYHELGSSQNILDEGWDLLGSGDYGLAGRWERREEREHARPENSVGASMARPGVLAAVPLRWQRKDVVCGCLDGSWWGGGRPGTGVRTPGHAHHRDRDRWVQENKWSLVASCCEPHLP
ncbi:unnamed protein product [Discosporangium mesarthrocarpum]